MYYSPIVHYGIKGMKWGIRRTPEQLGHKKEKEERKRIKQERRSASKNRRSLSDTDLKSRVDRLKLEKQLKELTDEDVNPGKVATKKFLSKLGTTVLTSAALGTLAYAGRAAVSGKVDLEEAAKYIFPNPNQKKK